MRNTFRTLQQFEPGDKGTSSLPDVGVVWDIVQFHPSYGYEDFISGIVATPEGNQLKFENEKRILLQIVEAAENARKANTDTKYVLIIDEINRGILGRIFGELILTLEYRNLGVRLLGQKDRIYLPDNLYIIGTMNTADRNIALVDHALRRRFFIIPCSPESEVISNYLDGNESIENVALKAFQAAQKAFYRDNAQQYDRDAHGYHMADYAVGHTYFMVKSLDELWINLRFQVVPLLEEYRKEGILSDERLNRTAIDLSQILEQQQQSGLENIAWLANWCESFRSQFSKAVLDEEEL